MPILLSIFRPIAFVLLTTFPLFSIAFAPPGDNDYLILEEKQYRIIFDKQYLQSIDTINQKIKVHLDNMSQFKNRKLEKRLTIILLSSKTQISRALATMFPSPTISLYPVGIIGLHEISLPIWFEGVFEHELNHIFQMSHSKSPKILKRFFIQYNLLDVYKPYPNVFLPRFILEGDSVLKESLFHYGGRLYSGYARALVYSQIKHHQNQIDQFMKDLLRFSYLTPHSDKEKYLHGGYFMAMLAETYPHETVNSFFNVDKILKKNIRKQIKETSVTEFLSPLFAEKFSFRHTRLFLEELTKVYFNRWLNQASHQKSSAEPILFKSAVCPAFGAAGNEIFFLTSDLKSVPKLRIFNKKTKQWTQQTLDLPLDKVFKIKGKYYARSRQEVKPHIIHYSLFSEGLLNNRKFDSKYVQDLWKNKTLYIDPKNNLDGFKLYVNDLFYSDTHSNALFDKSGNIYFFKQKNKVRTLYKNKRPLFSYSGYYGSLLGIETDGTVYFTGSSSHGSSVYQYKNGRISRSLSSDTVIRAKKINAGEFIACEVTPYGYEYKIIPEKLRRQKPVLYKYKFKKRNPLPRLKNNKRVSTDKSPLNSRSSTTVYQTSTSQKKTLNTKRQISSITQKNQKNKIISLKYKEYSPLKHIRYKGGNFHGFIATPINVFDAKFLFSDYLLHHIITLGYANIITLGHANAFLSYYLEDSLHLINLNYQNRIYPLEWELGYQTFFDSSSPNTFSPSSEESDLNMKHIGYLWLNYPLFKKGRWFSSISSLNTIHYNKNYQSTPNGLWRGQVNLGYSRSFPHNYASNRSSVLSVFFDNRHKFFDNPHKLDRNLNSFKSGVIWESVFHLGREFYIFPSVSYARSLNPEVNPTKASLYTKYSDYENQSAFFHSSDSYISIIDDISSSSFVRGDIYEAIGKYRYGAKSIGTMSLGLKKAYNISGDWISRFAPLMRIRWLILEDLINYDTKSSENMVIFGDDELLEKGTPPEKIQKLIDLSEKKIEKKIEKAAQYTQWLEWTMGIESEFIISNQRQVTLGFALGFRTSLKFWEDDHLTNIRNDSSVGISGSFDDKENEVHEKTMKSVFTNIYLKMPL